MCKISPSRRAYNPQPNLGALTKSGIVRRPYSATCPVGLAGFRNNQSPVTV